jgi:hypothetical protein
MARRVIDIVFDAPAGSETPRLTVADERGRALAGQWTKRRDGRAELRIQLPDDGVALRMKDVAARLGKSVRWLQEYLRANPCGRFAGRSRIFTEADYAQLIASLPRDEGPPALRIQQGRQSVHFRSDTDPWEEAQRLLAKPGRRRT